MTLALVTVFADEAGKVQVRGGQFESKLLFSLAARASVRGFAGVGVQLAAAGAPEAAVGLLRAFQQQDFVEFIEAVEQCGDFVGQSHFRID